MTGTQVGRKLLSWDSDIEPDTLAQAARTAKLPFVEGQVALMPDAHKALGSTVDWTVPEPGAVIPSCVVVDIGCSMVASETTLTAADLPDGLDALMPLVSARVPSGVGRGHGEPVATGRLAALGRPRTELSGRQEATAGVQFGTLGSGNHFHWGSASTSGTGCGPCCTPGRGGSGTSSRSRPSPRPRPDEAVRFIQLEDADLGYFVQGEPSFETYIADMMWVQRYAMGSRAVMTEQVLASLFEVVGTGGHVRTIKLPPHLHPARAPRRQRPVDHPQGRDQGRRR